MHFSLSFRVDRADVMLKLLFDYVDAGCTVQTEVKVEWSPSECAPIHGTCDAVIYDEDRGFLLIVDYKDGRVKVESADNAQLLMYASGFIQMNIYTTYPHNSRLHRLEFY
jgi:ATP-dependent exoDNAse (exonuclease V) beta subunit